jgi:hypothetical protein
MAKANEGVVAEAQALLTNEGIEILKARAAAIRTATKNSVTPGAALLAAVLIGDAVDVGKLAAAADLLESKMSGVTPGEALIAVASLQHAE